MEKKMIKTVIIFMALAFMVGLVSIEAATPPSTTDSDTQQKITAPNRGETRGMEKHRRGSDATPGANDLTETQIEALKAQRTAFQTATRDLRMEIQSKRLALQSELAKKEPDVSTAKSIQKEISDLTAELAQKRVEHIIEMKKIAPYAGGMEQLRSGTAETASPRGKRNT